MLLSCVPCLLYEGQFRTPHPSDGNGFVGRCFYELSYLPGFLILGSCPMEYILVTSSFHLPIISASPGSMNRDAQRNFPLGARMLFFVSCYTL